ncbi:hypothetical protein BO71DRAFT_453728 [Aspergillus ellipticus CBS 707.79]|uniref:Uncharacterized protein n=1 Tax=Aspergillus ellipticus CBS 707.79 TaxID=1448320 RepID=A0A319D3B4_9EURO|nr:hypothetical protein BO71DRAFT_453728 [Aspergillus ellipticus CBS 707.79]
MAQNAVGRLFRGQNVASLRQSMGSLTQQRRASTLPHFRPADTPGLDEALTRLREELFVPFGVNVRQRRLMFRQRYADKLDTEPVTASVGDEEVLLRPMDALSRPKKIEAWNAISLMQTGNDWQNLAPLLSGMEMSNRKVKAGRKEWIVRKAGAADALGVLVGCAQQAKTTGMRLNDVELVKRVFFELHLKAQRAEFKGEGVVKALGFGRQFAQLMETPDHVVHDLQKDPKRRPFVVGTLLELAAARALSEAGGKDVEGDVKLYSQRLLGCWKMGTFNREEKDWRAIDHMLQENVPVLNGMRLALQVKGIANDRSVSSGLKTHVNELSALIANQMKLAPEKVQAKPSLGLQQAQALVQG